jgi:hypothetical protein
MWGFVVNFRRQKGSVSRKKNLGNTVLYELIQMEIKSKKINIYIGRRFYPLRPHPHTLRLWCWNKFIFDMFRVMNASVH